MSTQLFPKTKSDAVKVTAFADNPSLTAVIQKLVVHPDYPMPEASLDCSTPVVEAGTTLSTAQILTVSYDQKNGKAGAFVSPFTVTNNGNPFLSNNATYLVSGNTLQMKNPFAVMVLDAGQVITGSIPYAVPAVQNNNLDYADETGSYAAGALAVSMTVLGKRRIFATSATALISTTQTSATIRAWADSTSYSDVASVTVAQASGAKGMGIAFPSGKTLTKVEYISAGFTQDWTDKFTKIAAAVSVNAADATTTNAKPYSVYYYNFDFGTSTGVFKFTFSSAASGI